MLFLFSFKNVDILNVCKQENEDSVIRATNK